MYSYCWTLVTVARLSCTIVTVRQLIILMLANAKTMFKNKANFFTNFDEDV